jgi:Ca2+-binding EF-hand superfamily protein
MSRSQRLAVAAILLLAPVASGAEGKAARHELVWLTESGPVRLSLLVEVEGKPLAALEEEYVRKLFVFYDHKQKGYLDATEAERAIRGSPLHRLLGTGPVRVADLDADGDGKVTRAELEAYCRRTARFFRVERLAPDLASERLTRALFDALDTNKDGKLSRAEVRAAAEVLAEFDQDEDECIVPLELVPNLLSGKAPILGRTKDEPESIDKLLAVRQPGEAVGALVKRLIARYDRDGDGKLSLKEIGLDAETFTRLDLNRDGRLDAEELAAWLAGGASFIVTLRLGPDVTADASVELADGKRRPGLADAVLQKGAGRLLLGVGKRRLDLATGAAAESLTPTGHDRASLLALYAKADPKNKGYVEAADVTGVSFKPLRSLLPLATPAGDGKLTRRDLEAYLELRRLADVGLVTLTARTQARGWFTLLDADRDGRLSVRELRAAWRRLADVHAEKSGVLTLEKDVLPLTLTLAQGRAIEQGLALYAPTARARPERGPLWFRKMDRNGDGDVSRKEWLGTRAEFDRIDRDGDGLISAEEAEAADRAGHAPKKP